MEWKLVPALFEAEAMMRIIVVDPAPYYVAKDVATILGYKNTVAAIAAHCKKAVSFGDLVGISRSLLGAKERESRSLGVGKERDSRSLDDDKGCDLHPLDGRKGGESPPLDGSKGGESRTFLHPETKLIPEGDVFRLIIRSSLPSAERFEVWLMEEVLPTLRRTGRYEISQDKRDFEEIGVETADGIKLRKINTVCRCFGERAGAQLWVKLGLEMVPAMKSILAQMDMLEDS